MLEALIAICPVLPCGIFSPLVPQIKMTFACSEYFSYSDGPMVVYETVQGCHYDVHWPNRAGCPSLPLIQRLQSVAKTSGGGGDITVGHIPGAGNHLSLEGQIVVIRL